MSLPVDRAREIIELRDAGNGWHRIESITGVPMSTVRRVVLGSHRGFSNELTPRQRTALLATMRATA